MNLRSKYLPAWKEFCSDKQLDTYAFKEYQNETVEPTN
jgi:hypothetical protein